VRYWYSGASKDTILAQNQSTSFLPSLRCAFVWVLPCHALGTPLIDRQSMVVATAADLTPLQDFIAGTLAGVAITLVPSSLYLFIIY
jgi:hypothetical protein